MDLLREYFMPSKAIYTQVGVTRCAEYAYLLSIAIISYIYL